MPLGRTILICAVFSVASFALGIVSFGLFLRSNAGTAFVLQYLNAPSQWPDVSSSVTSEPAKTAAIAATSSVQVPKAYATGEYQKALYDLVGTDVALASTSNALRPILLELNARSVSGKYDGIFDLVVAAKKLMAVQSQLITQFSQNISALAAANQTTSDAITKSATQTVVTKGQAMASSLSLYAQSLDQLISGSAPSAQQLSELSTRVKTVTTATAEFNGAMQALSLRITAASATR